jgi:hypothetical protein
MINAVLEENILNYRKKGYSISKISEATETPIPKVLETLSKFGTEDIEDLEDDYKILESS